MASELLSKWLVHYDPIHRGLTREGVANAVCATGGQFLPRIRGGYNLRRRERSAPAEAAVIVGTAGADAATVRTFPWVGHEPRRRYVYTLAAIGGGGMENRAEEASTEVLTDELGGFAGRRPNSPADVQLVPLADGRFAVRWVYLPQGQQAEPSHFQLYTNGSGDAIDYGAVAGTVPYRPGQIHFEYITQPCPHGQRVRWAVRASSAEAEDTNDIQVFGWAQAAPPPGEPTMLITLD